MKRLTATLLAAAMCMGTFAGCGSNTEETTDNSNAGAAAGETAAATTESQTASAENVHLDALNVYFVPSRDPEEIVTATEPLSDLLKNELARHFPPEQRMLDLFRAVLTCSMMTDVM